MPSFDVVVELHDIILEGTGAKVGILHPAVIEAAVARPLNYMGYEDTYDLHTVCALLIDSLARNHAFVEGNKRTALVTMLFTYRANGIKLHYSMMMNVDYENLVLWVVKQKPTIREIEKKLKDLTEKYIND